MTDPAPRNAPKPAADEVPESPHRLEQQRRENREALRGLGIDPYGQRTTGLLSVAEAREKYDAEADAAHQAATAAAKANPPGGAAVIDDRRAVAKVAGRIVLKRDGGKLIWLQLRDHTSGPAREEGEAAAATGTGGGAATAMVKDLQVAVSMKDCRAPGFDVAKLLDLGDVAVVEGPLMKTKTGEITIWASSIGVACKSIAPPPEKWSGLQDPEVRYRRRYVDLYANPETMQVAKLRALLVREIRGLLEERGYLEVETPTLQTLAGGAAARPFVTHMNALDIDLFMRVAPELYLKRLLVGGMPRVFEWSRNFRNEGLDRSHNPEFSMLELYEAFGSYETMMEIVEEMVRRCARRVKKEWASGTSALRADSSGSSGSSETSRQVGSESRRTLESLVLPYGELRIDYGLPFEKVTYEALFEKGLGFSMHDAARVRAEAKKRGVKTEGVADILLVNALFGEAESAIDPSRPTFLIDYPAPLCPLTRSKVGRPEIAERFEIYIGGMELGNAYTELNDPDIQEAKFREQLGGIDAEENTFRTFDEDFVYALKVGMPPAGGLGVGIDRLMMLMLDQHSIRDVLLFPLMKPQVQESQSRRIENEGHREAE
ncbi:MAG: lysine--tRNA ligase [Phycisphaerales bacterium]